MTSALVWNVESGIIDVNSEGRYNTQLAEWIANFGESEYSYLFNETNNYTIIAGSDEEDIQFNDATGEWSPALTLFEPTQVDGLYYRDIYFLEYDHRLATNVEGKIVLLDSESAQFGLTFFDDEWWDLDSGETEEAITACGGSVVVQATDNGSNAYTFSVGEIEYAWNYNEHTITPAPQAL